VTLALERVVVGADSLSPLPPTEPLVVVVATDVKAELAGAVVVTAPSVL